LLKSEWIFALDLSGEEDVKMGKRRRKKISPRILELSWSAVRALLFINSNNLPLTGSNRSEKHEKRRKTSNGRQKKILFVVLTPIILARNIS
jgi:hypothetical protein